MFLAAILLAVTLNINSVSPSEISSPDDVISLNASASGITTNASRLQAIFTKSLDPTRIRYFSFSQNQNGEWYQYKSSPTDSEFADYYLVSASNSAWIGVINVKFDNSSTGFKGAGDYFLRLKLYKTISSYSYSDPVTVKINWSESTQESGASTVSDLPAASVPEISWALPGAGNLGENFKVTYSLTNFSANTEYYAKVRGAQTQNGSNYLSENEAWTGFPVIKIKDNGTFAGEIIALVSEEKDAGDFSCKLRFRKIDSDSFVESDGKTISLAKKEIAPAKPATVSGVKVASSSALKPLILGTKSGALKTTNKPPVVSEVKKSQNYWPIGLMIAGLIFLVAPFVLMGRQWYNNRAL